MADVWLNREARRGLRDFRNRTRITPVEIIHSVAPASGAGQTESFPLFQAGDTASFLRSGALGEMPGRAYDLRAPGGSVISGRVRLVFDGLGTGADGFETRRLVTGADAMYSDHKGVEVSFKLHNVRYQLADVTLVDWTDEIVVEATAEEIDR